MIKQKHQRLKEVYEHLRSHFGIHTQIDFANAIGLTRPAVSSALNGNEAYLTDNLFKRICAAYPGTFNLKWMLTGEGDMLMDKQPETAPIEKQQDAITYAAIEVGKMIAQLTISLQKVEHLEESYKEKIKAVDNRLEKLDELIATLVEKNESTSPYPIAAESGAK